MATFATPGPRTLTVRGRDRQGTPSNTVSVSIDVQAEGFTAAIVTPLTRQHVAFYLRAW